MFPPGGPQGSPSNTGCYATVALCCNISNLTEEPDVAHNTGELQWQGVSPSHLCPALTMKSFPPDCATLHGWLITLFHFVVTCWSQRFWTTRNSRKMSDQEEIPTHACIILKNLCLFIRKRQVTLAKDVTESPQENGLLFLWACFLGYFDLHIWKQLKKQLIQI